MKQNEIKHMILDNKDCYAALCAHDTRFDGKFFVGVSSTGIYCRLICRAKLPKEENCTFFTSAAAAEAAGYRPCLKCRPELAPGYAPVDSAGFIARSAAQIMEENCPDDLNITELASMLSITERHLHRVFSSEYGVSPVQYMQTTKLFLAKSLLADTRLSITDVAQAAGFGSIRRFNDLFKNHYKLTPSDMRNMGSSAGEDSREICLKLGYRPPYSWDKLVSFLSARAIPGVESVEGNVYYRTVGLQKGDKLCKGWISVADRQEGNYLLVTLSCTLLPVLSQVLARVRRLFDVNCDPLKIFEKLEVMNEISPHLCEPGTRLPGCFDPYEMSVRAILGQQVTIKAARTLAMRFTREFGEKIDTPFSDLNYTFPDPGEICSLQGPVENYLGPLGITSARARSIFYLAEAIVSGSVVFTPTADPEGEMAKLLKLPGFGPWTVQYIGMRALNWLDAFPHTDYGVKKALPGMTPREILALSQEWKPWRSYATINLWNSLDKNHK